MEDHAIVELYFARAEEAISETAAKYGGYCYSIAYNILNDREDSEESVSDTYLAAWNAIPPRRPAILATFLGKITRHLAIDRWRARSAQKRGGGEVILALEELEECADSSRSPEQLLARRELGSLLNRFLESLPETERHVFLCRYWYLYSVAEIASAFGFSQSKTASMLHRTRGKLRKLLEKEGLR